MEPIVLDLGKWLGVSEKHREMISDIIKLTSVVVVMELLRLQSEGANVMDGVLAPAFLNRLLFQAVGWAAYHLVVKNSIRVKLLA